MDSDDVPNRGGAEEEEEGGGGDPAAWEALDKSLKQVQAVLDRNRALIQQVNENHQSKISDNMVKNVALIQEINDNVSSVVRMYSDLSDDFSRAFRRGPAARRSSS